MGKTLQILDSKFLKNGLRAWPSSTEDAVKAIEEGSHYTSLSVLLKSCYFSKKLKGDVGSWDYSDFICSALAHVYFNVELSVYSWSVITQLLMNHFITDDIFLFLKKNSFYNLDRRKEIIEGISFSFRYSRHSSDSVKCIRNVLDFIEMEKSEINKIIEAFLVKKDFTIITKFFFFLQLKKSEIETLIRLFKNNQIKKREYEPLRYRPRKSPRNNLLLSNGNQSDEKKENQLLTPFQSVKSLLGIVALSSTPFLLFLTRSANPFFSITKKLVVPDPVSICILMQ